MALDRLTADNFATIIQEAIADRDSTIDTTVGPVRDLFIDPFSYVLEQQNNRFVYLSELFTLKNASSVIPDDLDSLVYNEGLIRWNGVRSRGVATFYKVQPPTVDLTIPSGFPISSIADPLTGVSVSYVTTESKTMLSGTPTLYYNSSTNRYELDVAIASLSADISTNTGAGTITVLRRTLPGFEGVTNKASTYRGKSTESNTELATRYLLQVKGNQLGTPDGNKKYILDNFSSVSDVYVVYGNSTYLTREQTDAGAVDIWIRDTSTSSSSFTTFYPGIEQIISVDKQPCLEVTSVTSSVGGGTTYTAGVDYEVVIGEGEYSYSKYGVDGIRFLDTIFYGGINPGIGNDVTINYKYCSTPGVLQTFFTQSEFYQLGCDKLFRLAQPVDIYIDANLKAKFGSSTTLSSNIRDALIDYVNNLLLGDDIEQFDLDRVVSRFSGVDNWTYNYLCKLGETVINDIVIGPNEYAWLDPNNLVINIV
jgi:hypothetical protein